MRRLDQKDSRRVGRAVERLVADGHGDLKRVTSIEPPEWRLRVGSVRVRFRYRPEDAIVEILRVLPRGKAYDR